MLRRIFSRTLATLFLFVVCAGACAAQPGALPARVVEANAAAYESFVAAVDAVAPAGGALVISTPQTLTADKLVPAGVALRFEPGGVLTAAKPVTVTLQEPLTAGRRQIFGAGVTVKFGQQMPDTIYPEWWGARGDNVTDDQPAFAAMTAALRGHGGHVLLGPGRTYFLARTWEIDVPLLVESRSADEWYQAAVLRFPADTTGIRVYNVQVKNGPQGPSDEAKFTVLRNFALEGGLAGASAGNCNVAGLTMTRLTGPRFDGQAGWFSGNTVTINGREYVLGTDAADADHVTLRPPIVMVLINPNGTILNASYDSWDAAWQGATLTVGGRTFTISTITNGVGARATTAPAATGFPDNTGTGVYLGYATLSDLKLNGVAYHPNFYHGVDARGTLTVERVKAWNFAGSGIFLNAVQIGNSKIPDTSPNTNVSRLERNSLYYNLGHGIFTRGLNSNQSLIVGNDATNNHGAGLAELSFLGNNYLSNHTSFNYRGAKITTQGGVNVSLSVGDYAEGGQPPEFTDQNQLVIGGNHGAGVTGAGGLIQNNGAFTEHRNLRVYNDDMNQGATKRVALVFAPNKGGNTLFGFGAGEDQTNTSQGGSKSVLNIFPWQFGYDELRAGWFSLYYGGNYGASQGNSVVALSGSNATEGGGRLWLYKGIDFIGPNRAAGLAPDGDGILKLTGGAQGGGAMLYSPLKTDAFNAALTLNFAEGNVHTVTLKGNVTSLTLMNLKAGGEYVVRVAQDGVGGRTVAWANVRWAGGQAPRLSAGPNQIDIFRFISPDGLVLEEVSRALGVR